MLPVQLLSDRDGRWVVGIGEMGDLGERNVPRQPNARRRGAHDAGDPKADQPSLELMAHEQSPSCRLLTLLHGTPERACII
jgi:hypothetical protein